jgi:hypothetical protein
MEIGDKACSICVRRPRDEGGNDSCPLPQLAFLANQCLTTHQCASFKLGDIKPKAVSPEGEQLF